MSRLIIVAGAGGAGKSFFLRLWASFDRNACRIFKFVSMGRAPRECEIRTGEADLIFDASYDPNTEKGKSWYEKNHPNLPIPTKLKFHSKEFDLSSPQNNPYIYDYHGSFYEVDIDSIDKALKEDKTPIVIVRKCETITNLLQRFSDALIVYVQSILSGTDLVKKLIDLGESENDAKKRESRNKEDLTDYINNIQRLPKGVRVVVNDFDESTNSNMFTQIRDIYKEEINNYGFKDKSIFVVQSYMNNEESKENFSMIKSAAKECFGNDYNSITRADMRQDGCYLIPNNVWDCIDKSDCIICDITNDRCDSCSETVFLNSESIKKKRLQGVSSNVWLELGYAIKAIKTRGLEPAKRLIIISKSNTKTETSYPPIDIGGNAINIIKYATQAQLKDKVLEQLRGMFKCEENK